MAELYCDHGAYGSSNRLGLDVPAWGVPQEGDGAATAASTASSTASVLLNGQPTAGQVLGVCGVNLLAAASGNGTTSFTIGANLDATANNIANLINASTTSVSAGVSNGGAVSSTLKNFVYARGPAGGAPSATVQIMMRVGSSSLNSHAGNQITTTFGNSPTITQWSGGVSGCYGYLLTDTALLALATTQASYGALLGVLSCKPSATTSADRLWVRTGHDPLIHFNAPSGNISSSRDSTWYPRTIFDTNTKWTGDPSTGTCVVQATLPATFAVTLNLITTFGNVTNYVKCLRPNNLVFRVAGTGTAVFNVSFCSNGTTAYVEGIKWEDTTTTTSPKLRPDHNTATSGLGVVQYVNCMYERTVAQPTLPSIITLAAANNCISRIRYDNCLFKWTINGTSDPGPVCAYATSFSSQLGVGVEFNNCDFQSVGYSEGLSLIPSGQPTWASLTTSPVLIKVDQCTGLKFPSTFIGFLTSTLTIEQDSHMLYMNLGNQGYRVENCRGVADWLPTADQPTLGATLPDGVTPWSLRLVWSSLGNLSSQCPFSAPWMKVYNRLSTSTRSITLELVVPDTLTLTDDMFRMHVDYVSTDGKSYFEETTAVLTSTASWTDAAGFSAKKLTVTTSNPVLANTEVAVKFDITATTPSGSNENIYLNPEPQLS